MRIVISSLFIIALIFQSALLCPAAEVIKRNISWSFEGNNDPIVQISNQGEVTRVVKVRLLFGSDSYRSPEDIEVPSGENRFLRMREIFNNLLGRYPDLRGQISGLVQLEFEGTNREIQTQLVNLNPRSGIMSEKSSENSPVIRAIQPQSGDAAGGTVVTIYGGNFNDSTIVRFGGVPAPHTRQSDSVMIAVAPAHPDGEVDVQVANGRRNTSLRHGFRYEEAGPVIVDIDPESGSMHGGYKVNIRGRNFKQGVVVRWNGGPVNASFMNPENISVMAPSGPGGSVAVEVINPDKRHFVLNDAFRYKALPHISSVVPDAGNPEGGYTVTVYGSNFESGDSVLFGDKYGQTTFINPNALAAIAPAGDSGNVNISVTSKEGDKDTLQDGFRYNQPPHIVSIEAEPNPIVRNTTTTITVQAEDPEADELNYEYRVAQGPPGGMVSGQGHQAIYHSPNTVGRAIIQVTVYDQHGAKAQRTIEIEVE